MATQLQLIDNYIIVTNTITGEVIPYTQRVNYVDNGNTIDLIDPSRVVRDTQIKKSDLLNQVGVAFTDNAELLDWLRKNTGFSSGGGTSVTELHKHILYNPITDTIQTDRIIETILSTFRLGKQIALSSGGLSLFISNLSKGIASIFPKLSFKDQSVLANKDETGVLELSCPRVNSDNEEFEPSGAVATSGSTNYHTTFTVFDNNFTFGVDVVVEEAVIPTDYLHYVIYAGADDTGVAIYEQKITNETLAIGEELSWDFRPTGSLNTTAPFQGEKGEIITVVMLKSSTQDGTRSPFLVRQSAGDPAKHWSRTHSRTWDDVKLDLNHMVSINNETVTVHEPTTFVAYTSANPSTIRVYKDNLNSFSVRDKEKSFSTNSVLVNFYADNGTTIESSVTLNVRNGAFQFDKNSVGWYYSIGTGETIFVTGNLTASSDFSTSFSIVGEVDTFALLPAFGTSNGETWLVETTTGTWLLGTRRLDGLYRSDGSSWVYMGATIAQITGAEITAGTATTIRRYSPLDIRNLVEQHAPAEENRVMRGFPTAISDVITLNAGWTYIIESDLSMGNVRIFVAAGDGDVRIIGRDMPTVTSTHTSYTMANSVDFRGTLFMENIYLENTSAGGECIFFDVSTSPVSIRLAHCTITSASSCLWLNGRVDFIANSCHFSCSTSNALRINGAGNSNFTIDNCTVEGNTGNYTGYFTGSYERLILNRCAWVAPNASSTYHIYVTKGSNSYEGSLSGCTFIGGSDYPMTSGTSGSWIGWGFIGNSRSRTEISTGDPKRMKFRYNGQVTSMTTPLNPITESEFNIVNQSSATVWYLHDIADRVLTTVVEGRYRISTVIGVRATGSTNLSYGELKIKNGSAVYAVAAQSIASFSSSSQYCQLSCEHYITLASGVPITFTFTPSFADSTINVRNWVCNLTLVNPEEQSL